MHASEFLAANIVNLFQPKGQIPLELLVFQSVIGPIGQPAAEAVYPIIGTADGEPMNAQYDYVLRMALDEEGGIAIHIAAEQPEGVPDENWLPVVRGDYGMDIIMRIYAPDLEKSADWSPPVAEKLE